MGIFGRRNTGNDIDLDQARSEQAALLDQIDQFRLQQLFLEEQRQRLIDQQEFDFQNLLSGLNALQEQQQQGFQGQLSQSEAFLNDLTARNQQLQGVVQGQSQTQQNVAAQQQQDIQGSQNLLSQLLADIGRVSGQATQTSGERSQTQAEQAINIGQDFRRARGQQLSNLAAAADQRIGRERQNLLSRTVQDERKARQRRETSRANLRGQPGPTVQDSVRPQTGTTVRTAQARSGRGQQIQQRRQRAGEPGFLSGTQRSLSAEELERIRRELQQGRAGFVGPISGRRTNIRSRRVL